MSPHPHPPGSSSNPLVSAIADKARCPRVSVLTSTYQARPFVEIYVAALKAQTASDWECVIVDDGSTDGTVEALHSEIDGDSRFRVTRRPRSGWPAANRQYALELARGEFIAFCDQDDFWWPTKLEVQLLAFDRHPDALFCHTGRRFAGPAATPPPRSESGETAALGETIAGALVVDSIERALLRRCAITCSSVMARREAILRVGGIHPGLAAVDDYHLWLRLADSGPFLWFQRPLLTCTLHRQNLSSSPSVMASGLEALVEDLATSGRLTPRVLKAVRAQALKAKGVAAFIDRPVHAAGWLARAWTTQPERRTALMAAGVGFSSLLSKRRRVDIWRRIQTKRAASLQRSNPTPAVESAVTA